MSRGDCLKLLSVVKGGSLAHQPFASLLPSSRYKRNTSRLFSALSGLSSPHWTPDVHPALRMLGCLTTEQNYSGEQT